MKKSIYITLILLTSLFAKGDPNQDLWDAINEPNLKKLNRAIKEGALVNDNPIRDRHITQSISTHIPLCHAIFKYKLFGITTDAEVRFEIIKALVNAGANVNARDESGYYESPLFLAASNFYPDVIDLLLERGAVDSLEIYGMCPGHDGGQTPLGALIIKLEDYLSNIKKATSEEEKTKAQQDYLEIQECIDILISAGANINPTKSNGTPLLIHCIFRRCLKGIETLLLKGADVNVEYKSKTALTWLVDQYNGSLFEKEVWLQYICMMLEAGANYEGLETLPEEAQAFLEESCSGKITWAEEKGYSDLLNFLCDFKSLLQRDFEEINTVVHTRI